MMHRTRTIATNAALAIFAFAGLGVRAHQGDDGDLTQQMSGADLECHIPDEGAALYAILETAPPSIHVGSASVGDQESEYEDGAIELGELKCPKSKWGVDCMILCAEYGVACAPQIKHPYKGPDGGKGTLFKCCSCKNQQKCWYSFDNGDICTVFPNQPRPATCGYQGGL
jgi:hypothetical protein